MDLTTSSIYEPLDSDSYEIRMLTILPGPLDSPIRCLLKRASLISPLKYSALSYCWGDPEVTTNIFVNNVEYPVTTNLADALRRLRLERIPRVWVDALCINQYDRQEKSLQIRNMRLVYSRAKTTYAWIGTSELDKCAVAISYFKSVSEVQDSLQSAEATKDTQHGIIDFLTRQYWTRRWIIQELAVSSNVQILCGDEAISLKNLKTALQVCQRLRWWNLEMRLAYDHHLLVLITIHQMYKNNDLFPLWRLLFSTKRFESTNSRDKIYALIGISSDGNSLVPWPNYQQPLETITMDFTSALISKYKHLDFILMNRSDKTCSTTLPTWSPNWLSDESLPSNLQTEDYLLDKAPRLANAIMLESVSHGDHTLLVEGVVIGTITDLTSTLGLPATQTITSYQPMKNGSPCKGSTSSYYESSLNYRVVLLSCVLNVLTSGLETPQIYSGAACGYLLKSLLNSSSHDFPKPECREENSRSAVSNKEVIAHWISTNPEFRISGKKFKDLFFTPKNDFLAKCLIKLIAVYGCRTWYIFFVFCSFLMLLLPVADIISEFCLVTSGANTPRFWVGIVLLATSFGIMVLAVIFIRKQYHIHCGIKAQVAEIRRLLAHDSRMYFQTLQKLAITEMGMLSVVLADTRVGDKICYIAGCKSAAVLRECRVGHRRRHQVVGSAKVYMVEEDRKKYRGFAEDDAWDRPRTGTKSVWRKSKQDWYEISKPWAESLAEYKNEGRWQQFDLI